MTRTRGIALRDRLSIAISPTRLCAIFIFKATVQFKGVSAHIFVYTMISMLIALLLASRSSHYIVLKDDNNFNLQV